MVQEAPAPTLDPQVLVWEKSPPAVISGKMSSVLPVLVRVTSEMLRYPPPGAGAMLKDILERLAQGRRRFRRGG